MGRKSDIDIDARPVRLMKKGGVVVEMMKG